MSEQVCPLCDDLGMVMVEEAGGRRHAEPCSCRLEKRTRKLLARARIPARYEHCTLDSYEASFSGADPSLRRAHAVTQRFVRAYPLETQGTGLLLTGSIGVGKTHLAVGVLRELMSTRGASGLFYDYRELLKTIQNTYSAKVSTTESEILQPVFNAEVLVLDEIGAAKVTDWVWDTVALILNARYNDKRTTILTTNYSNVPPGAIPSNLSVISQARSAVREETLGDRIGERMRSRLQEMCLPIDMNGKDFRQHVKRAFLG